MKADQRALYRTAEAVRDVLAKQIRPAPFLPTVRWKELEKLARQIEFCRRRSLESACRVLDRAWESNVAALAAALNSDLAERRLERPHVPTLHEVYDDLSALGEEFEEVDFDLAEGTISVTTEAITLHGVSLGPFQICLDWRDLSERSPYRVIALDPRPAAFNQAVTHPHVQDERLCEGDGREAIEAALAQGRIGDFFLIVSQLLRTYAQGRAYVELSRWAGAVCSDCGVQVDDDERFSCDRCDAELCGECLAYCERCDRGVCSECIKSCNACQQAVCEACLETCSGCASRCCIGCLDDQICSGCRAEREEETDEEQEENETKEIAGSFAEHDAGGKSRRDQVAVQPDRLGQTALSTRLG